MNCVIPGLNIKVIAKALQALSKVGDDLFIEGRKEKLSFISLNLSKTVCVRYHFLDSFFSSYHLDEEELKNDGNDKITCKIHMKVLLPLFKGNHLEKKLEWVKLEYENNNDLIIFKMKYKCDDILMLHKLRLMEPESLTIQVNTNTGSNSICASSSFYNQLLTMFSNSDDEIIFEISKEKMVVRNYLVGAPYRPKSVRSQVNLNSSEFNIFQIEKETTINFSLKPFRTAIHFAEVFNLNIVFNFDTGGKPLSIVMKSPIFETNFIVATLNPHSDAQSTISTNSIPAKITQKVNDLVNITVEDQQVLENVDWDDFNMETEHVENNNGTKLSKKTSFKDLMEIPRNKTVSNSSGSDKENGIRVLDNLDVVPRSPESPRSKKAKLVFGRCFDPTFSCTRLGEILAANSDSE